MIRRCSNCEYFVSIHAPRFREAMQDIGESNPSSEFVSIHAPRFREAMRLMHTASF